MRPAAHESVAFLFFSQYNLTKNFPSRAAVHFSFSCRGNWCPRNKMEPASLGPKRVETKDISYKRSKHLGELMNLRFDEHIQRERRSTFRLAEAVIDAVTEESRMPNAHSRLMRICVAEYPAYNTIELKAFMREAGLIGDVFFPEKNLAPIELTPLHCSGCETNPLCSSLWFTIQ